MIKKTVFSLLAVLVLGVIALILMTATNIPTTVIFGPVQEPVLETPTPTEVLPATKDDMIILETPLPGSTITSPVVVTGRARGNWYFEATFPVTLVDWDGRIIAEGYAQAEGDWMTEEYVPFTGTVTYTTPDLGVSDRGWIILQKHNASDDPSLDNALEVPIRYQP